MTSYREIAEQSLHMLSKGIPSADILTHIATECEKMMGIGSAVSILLIDKDGLLGNGASPGLPNDYLKAIDGIRPNPNIGTCAAAAATGKMVITSSFLDDDKWSELKHLPLSIGYKAAWSVPIRGNNDQVLGTIGVYRKTIHSPHEDEKGGVELLSKAAGQILSCQAIEI